MRFAALALLGALVASTNAYQIGVINSCSTTIFLTAVGKGSPAKDNEPIAPGKAAVYDAKFLDAAIAVRASNAPAQSGSQIRLVTRPATQAGGGVQVNWQWTPLNKPFPGKQKRLSIFNKNAEQVDFTCSGTTTNCPARSGSVPGPQPITFLVNVC